ncbi:MAG: TIGR03790 family protein [Deltaproteobacteria bacterium]|nr:TIGR03790 family protein [Deltaproteobacteria bacterium]
MPFGQLRTTRGEYFLVGRIDGADAAAALALVERTRAAEVLAQAGALAGTVYVDGNRGLPHPATDVFGSYEAGEWNIVGVGQVFANDGRYAVVEDFDAEELGTAPAPLTAPEALYYAGWYSFGNYNDVFTWQPGAIGGHLDSCSACDLRGERDWSAMALRRGITATFGAVNEPYVAGMPAYDQFFAYLLQGASFGEAAAEATQLGAWMMVWVGDPLYRPYGVREVATPR